MPVAAQPVRLTSELPSHIGAPKDAIDRLYKILHVCRLVLKNLQSGHDEVSNFSPSWKIYFPSLLPLLSSSPFFLRRLMCSMAVVPAILQSGNWSLPFGSAVLLESCTRLLACMMP
jgi:hypothetical protein